jgi:tRNA A37 threonylcarbamoyladenosine synthetase subunit TsaC/SUA5/YrdC
MPKLIRKFGQSSYSASARLIDDEDDNELTFEVEKAELFDRLNKLVDIIIDDDTELGLEGSTILDMTTDPPEVIREGLGWAEVAAWL